MRVQRSPKLLLAVKKEVDRRREAGRFLLTGSANLLLLRRVSESLAGRAIYFTLWPLTRGEQQGNGEIGCWAAFFEHPQAQWPELLAARQSYEDPWQSAVVKGGYPTPSLQLKTDEERLLWFKGYAQTYLERDLQEIASIHSLVDFRRLMRAACLRLGNLLNQTELGRDVGMPQPTVHRYLNLLEASYQLVRLQPYSVNRTKRIIKTPKLYWADVGLALSLSGEERPRGAHLENHVLQDLLAWRGTEPDAPEILFWRTATGEEVDFVVEWKGRLLPVEIKAANRVGLNDAKGLRSFREEYGKSSLPGLLLHCGRTTEWLAEGVLSVPWWKVL